MVRGGMCSGATYRFTRKRLPSLETSYVNTSVLEIGARPRVSNKGAGFPVEKIPSPLTGTAVNMPFGAT